MVLVLGTMGILVLFKFMERTALDACYSQKCRLLEFPQAAVTWDLINYDKVYDYYHEENVQKEAMYLRVTVKELVWALATYQRT